MSAVPVWVWLATVLAFAAIVVLDLVVIARRRHAVTTADATRWVLFYIGLAAVFAGLLYVFRSTTSGNEFVAGYVMEYSLSVDNLFVFIIIMARFAVPQLAQDKVLYIGIVLSMLMRTVFIVAGAAAVNAASWVFYVFGAFLVYSAVGSPWRARTTRTTSRRVARSGACVGSCRSPRTTRAPPSPSAWTAGGC